MKMSHRKKRRNSTVPVLFGILIILLAALIMMSVIYLDTAGRPLDGESDVSSGEVSSSESVSAFSGIISEESQVSQESNISSKENVSSDENISSEENTSSEPVVDDDPLVNANYTTEAAEGFPYYIAVNRKQNMVIIYSVGNDGYYSKPYKAFVCSTGLPDEEGVVHTPIGTFNTTNQYTWRLLEGDVYGQYATRIVNHILFHSVPYFEKTKDSLEWEEYNKLGEAASLGCIRLTVEDAKWIYDNCPKGTTVTIYDSDRTEPFAKPIPPEIPAESPYRDWDPTDPDENNPWLLHETE